MICSACFLLYSRPISLGGGAIHNGQDPLVLLIMKCPTGLPAGQSNGGITSVGAPSSQMTLTCVKLTKHWAAHCCPQGWGCPYRRKESIVMDAVVAAFAVFHQSQPEVPMRSWHRRLRLQQIEEGQGVSFFCITVLTMPDRNNRWGRFHFSSWFWRDLGSP